MPILRTVLGDIPADQMGITYAHQYVTLGYAGARQEMGDQFDREAVLSEICDDLRKAMEAHGVRTIVDVTPLEAGRDVDILKGVAERLGINVVAATGFFAQLNGLPFYWRFMEVEKYEERLVREITEGAEPNKVKCGIIRVAIGEATLREREEKAFRAAASVSKKLGVAVYVFTRDGWLDEYPGPLQALDIMLSEGADPSRIYVGHLEHVFDNPGPGNFPMLLEIARRGVYLTFDIVGRHKDKWDEPRANSVAKLFAEGYGNRVILAMDHQGAWVPERPPLYKKFGSSYLDLYDFLPKLRQAGLKEEQIETILVDNPRDLLTF